MGLLKNIRLRRKFAEYSRHKDLNRLLHTDWDGDPLLEPLFEDISKRLQREENKKLQQKQAEVLALQNQINPHFLYNTLEAIRSDALMADCDEIAETTEALATFFRYTISNVQEYVSFSDELDNVENYFTIQRCRFGDKIDLELIIENEQLLEAKMPKLILQPLVENAVIHGLEGKIDGGVVKIKIENSETTLFLSVYDNGLGMSEKETDRINQMLQGDIIQEKNQNKKKRGGIALHNVNSRIHLMFGEDYGLKIYSSEGVGTECYLTMPLIIDD